MHSVSALYNSILSGVHSFEVKVSIAGTDYGMDTLTALRTSRAAFGTGSPQLGLAPAGEIAVSLYLASSSVPRMAELRPCVRVVDEDGRTSEWIAKGVYYVDTRETDSSGLLTLRGYDAMLKAEQPFPSVSHGWPATDLTVVSDVASLLGVTVDPRTTALMTGSFSISLPAQYTARETLAYIAGLYGGSFVITDDNKLLLLCLWNLASAADLTLPSYRAFRASPAFPACTGVRFLLDDDTEIFAGNENGYVYEVSDPFGTQAAANRLLTKMRNFVYRPFTVEGAVLNPAAELGDTLSVPDGLTGLFSLDTVFDALCLAGAAAPQDEALDHEFPYVPAGERRFTRRMDQFQSELTLQSQSIEAKVSRTGGDPSSFAWVLDAEMFRLLSDGLVVMQVDENGLTVQGTINATAGNIGGCTITNGVLTIANANITNLNASKINAGTLAVARIANKSLTGGKLQDYTIGSSQLGDGSAVNRVIGSSAVSYGKTSFQTTLDQVGTNKANIDTINGYFTGSASFNSLLASSIALNSHYLALETVTVGGVNRKLVTWS